MPEVALLLLMLVFAGLVFYIGQDQGRTLPIDKVIIGQSTYPFWAVGVAAVLLSVSAFFYLISLKIV